jgi:hypothetical protein
VGPYFWWNIKILYAGSPPPPPPLEPVFLFF